MELQEFKDDFAQQLQIEQQKIHQATQQALKLQGAIDAVELIMKHANPSVVVDELPKRKVRPKEVVSQEPQG